MKRIAAAIALAATASLLQLAPVHAAPSVCAEYHLGVDAHHKSGHKCLRHRM